MKADACKLSIQMSRSTDTRIDRQRHHCGTAEYQHLSESHLDENSALSHEYSETSAPMSPHEKCPQLSVAVIGANDCIVLKSMPTR